MECDSKKLTPIIFDDSAVKISDSNEYKDRLKSSFAPIKIKVQIKESKSSKSMQNRSITKGVFGTYAGDDLDL